MDHRINGTVDFAFDPLQVICQECGDPIVYLFMPEFENIPDHARKPVRWTIRWPERLRCLACWRAAAQTPAHHRILEREERNLTRAFRTIFQGLSSNADHGAPTIFGTTNLYRDIPGAQQYSRFTVLEYSLFVPSLPKDLDTLPLRSMEIRFPKGPIWRWISPLVEVASESTNARLQKTWDLETGEVKEHLLDTAGVPEREIKDLRQALEPFEERVETRGGPEIPLTEDEVLAAIRETLSHGLKPTANNVAAHLPGRSIGDRRLRQLRQEYELFPNLRWPDVVRLATN
jgi:hypothetical protein